MRVIGVRRLAMWSLVSVAVGWSAAGAQIRLPGTGPAADSMLARATAVRESVRRWRAAHDVVVLREFMSLLAIPNVARDSANIRRNANALVAMMQRRGITTRLLETPGAPPVVYGELRAPGATHTLVLYAHYDGQPVTPDDWTSPPWTPVLRDGPLTGRPRSLTPPVVPGSVNGNWYVFARSAGDDKATIMAQLSALDALKANGLAPSVNLQFFYEGEEEAGSPHLRETLSRYAALFPKASSVTQPTVTSGLRLPSSGGTRQLSLGAPWIFGDGPNSPSGRQEIVFGVRGITGVTMTVYGASRALHDGHYGNWAPNPLAMIANLIASMRDADGTIRIAGFYDDVTPLSTLERRALGDMPDVDQRLRQQLSLGATEANDAPLADRILLPALNVRGIVGGAVGPNAANAIPSTAQASIDFRLVPRQTPERVRSLVEQHIALQGYYIVHSDPTAADLLAHSHVIKLEWEPGYPATRLPLESDIAKQLGAAVDVATGVPAIRVPSMGASLPTNVFMDVIGAPLVILPIANFDDNQHAANENLRLQNLWDGIELYAGVMRDVGALLDGAPIPAIPLRPGFRGDSLRARP